VPGQATDEAWANVPVSRVAGILTGHPPESWAVIIARKHTPPITEMFRKESPVTLDSLAADPRETAARLPCVPLYIKHADNNECLLPEIDTRLQPGDQLLSSGHRGAEKYMRWIAHNFHALGFICTGDNSPSGSLWRWLARHQKTSGPTAGV